MRQRSLGSASAAVRGIVISALTTGTPLGIDLSAGHRQRDGDRIAICGNAADNGTFGEWTLASVAAASAKLVGATGSTALSGTPVVAALMDVTPFIYKNTVVAAIAAGVGGAATDGIATVVIEGADNMSGTGFTYMSGSTPTAGLTSVLKTGEQPMAFNDFGGTFVEINLKRYMTMRLSAWTSGTFGVNLLG